MLESLKRQMVLSESKTASDNMLQEMCFNFSEDSSIEEDIIMPDQPQSTENDAVLDQIIDSLPEDESMEEELLESQNLFIEQFLGEEGEVSPASKVADGTLEESDEDTMTSESFDFDDYLL